MARSTHPAGTSTPNRAAVPTSTTAPSARPTARQAHRGDAHAALLRLVTDYLRCLPHCWFSKIAAGPYQQAGLPDLLCAIAPHGPPQPALFVAIELKTGQAQLSAQQRAIRADILAVYGHYWVIHTIEELETELLDAGLSARGILT